MAKYLIKCNLANLNTKSKIEFFNLFKDGKYKKSVLKKKENFLIITSQLFSFLQLELEENKHFKKITYDLVNYKQSDEIEPIVTGAKMASYEYDNILRVIYNN